MCLSPCTNAPVRHIKYLLTHARVRPAQSLSILAPIINDTSLVRLLISKCKLVQFQAGVFIDLVCSRSRARVLSYTFLLTRTLCSSAHWTKDRLSEASLPRWQCIVDDSRHASLCSRQRFKCAYSPENNIMKYSRMMNFVTSHNLPSLCMHKLTRADVRANLHMHMRVQNSGTCVVRQHDKTDTSMFIIKTGRALVFTESQTTARSGLSTDALRFL